MRTMNRKQFAIRVLIAIAASAMPQSAVLGQATCQCQTHPNIAAPSVPASAVPQPRMVVNSRLPASWPRQWGDPVSTESTPLVAKSALTGKQPRSDAVAGKQDSQNTSSMSRDGRTRDPFTGAWVAAGSQTRWSKVDRTGNPTNSSQRLASADNSLKSKSTTSDKSASGSKTSDSRTSGFSSGAAYGGGSSPGGSGGGASGGLFGGGMSGSNSGGFSGGSTSTPRTSGSSGGVSGAFSGGSGGSGKQRSASTPDPHTGNGGGLAEIPPPHCPVPPVLPEIPSTGGDPVSPTDPNPGNVAGEAPIVPEPGSIVLLGIAIGVGGAGYIRRCRRRADSPIPASL